jgi:hypothetical protein
MDGLFVYLFILVGFAWIWYTMTSTLHEARKEDKTRNPS